MSSDRWVLREVLGDVKWQVGATRGVLGDVKWQVGVKRGVRGVLRDAM